MLRYWLYREEPNESSYEAASSLGCIARLFILLIQPGSAAPNLQPSPISNYLQAGAEAEQEVWQTSWVNTDQGDEKPSLTKTDTCGDTGRSDLTDGLGLAVTGAFGRYKLAMKDVGEHVLEPGINLIISSRNGPVVLSALNQILGPLRERLQCTGAVEALEDEHARKAAKKLEREYQAYRQSSILPDRQYLDQVARKLARLPNRARPLVLLEQPWPGQLMLWAQRYCPSSILAIYDDFAFSTLLNHSRNRHGMLDINLVTKSWHQISLITAGLESSSDQRPLLPKVWIIVVARPETVAQFLVWQEPHVAGLASCSWLIEGTRRDVCSQRVSHWEQVVAKLVTWWPPKPKGSLG